MLKDCKESGYGADIDDLPRSAVKAKELGFQYYYNGKTCKYGHDSPRYTSGGSCVFCQRQKNKKRSNGLGSSVRSYAIANITRLNAAREGQKTYVPAYPCKHGHSLRWVSSNNCVECGRQSDARRKHKNRWSRIRREYGIDESDFREMLLSQGHKCKICLYEIKEKTSHIDHCHTTGDVRGILCQRCNQAIGLLRDDKEIITRAASYVEGKPK